MPYLKEGTPIKRLIDARRRHRFDPTIQLEQQTELVQQLSNALEEAHARIDTLEANESRMEEMEKGIERQRQEAEVARTELDAVKAAVASQSRSVPSPASLGSSFESSQLSPHPPESPFPLTPKPSEVAAKYLREQLKQLGSDCAKKEALVEKAERRCATITQERDDALNMVREMKAAIDGLKEALRQSKEETQSAIQINDDLSKQLSTFTVSKETTSREAALNIARFSAQISQLTEDLSRAKVEVADAEKREEEAWSRVAELETVAGDARLWKAERTATNLLLRANIEAALRAAAVSKEDCSQSRKAEAEMRGEADSLRHELWSTQAELRRVRANLSAERVLLRAKDERAMRLERKSARKSDDQQPHEYGQGMSIADEDLFVPPTTHRMAASMTGVSEEESTASPRDRNDHSDRNEAGQTSQDGTLTSEVAWDELTAAVEAGNRSLRARGKENRRSHSPPAAAISAALMEEERERSAGDGKITSLSSPSKAKSDNNHWSASRRRWTPTQSRGAYMAAPTDTTRRLLKRAGRAPHRVCHPVDRAALSICAGIFSQRSVSHANRSYGEPLGAQLYHGNSI